MKTFTLPEFNVPVGVETMKDKRPVWRPIETAPSGVSRNGKASVCWMMLAWPDGEGDFHTGSGMRVNDRFYACGVFHCGGPYDGKQNEFREIEVTPTHWMPLPEAPK